MKSEIKKRNDKRKIYPKIFEIFPLTLPSPPHPGERDGVRGLGQERNVRREFSDLKM
jgi:hypothetical protein